MYVYEAEFPIDYFNGMTALKDYIKLCVDNKEDDSIYSSYFDLQKFLVNSFMNVKCSVTSWEGDIRGDDIFISAIPAPDNTTYKLLAFKQDNNGTSFIVSEFLLPKSDQFKLVKLENLVSNVMMKYFEESFSLTLSLVKKVEMEFPSKVSVINLDDIKEIVDRHDNKPIEANQASRYFRDADKSVHVYPHENDATTISQSRPAAESATMTLRQDALPAAPGQCLPTWGSSASMPRSNVTSINKFDMKNYQKI